MSEPFYLFLFFLIPYLVIHAALMSLIVGLNRDLAASTMVAVGAFSIPLLVAISLHAEKCSP